MKEKIYNFKLLTDLKLIKLISKLSRYDAAWSSIERREGQSLKQLRTFATIQSVGASTRIEGSKMSDRKVEELLNDIDISKLEERDAQEVIGYSNVLNLIVNSFDDIKVRESDIKNLHNMLLKHSQKDQWHRGNYKKHTNAVEATLVDGSKQIIFRTEEAGVATEDAMRKLISWYNSENEDPVLLRIAAFVYDFLSIHPFQDGNGRLSRLLTTLLLVKAGYKWIQYISFEHEIENNKKDYYQSLRICQAQRPNEDFTDWVHFFLNSLLNVQIKLEKKLTVSTIEKSLMAREKAIYVFIMHHPGCKSSDITNEFRIPPSTTKKILSDLVVRNIIYRHGKGAGTNYSL